MCKGVGVDVVVVAAFTATVATGDGLDAVADKGGCGDLIRSRQSTAPTLNRLPLSLSLCVCVSN